MILKKNGKSNLYLESVWYFSSEVGMFSDENIMFCLFEIARFFIQRMTQFYDLSIIFFSTVWMVKKTLIYRLDDISFHTMIAHSEVTFADGWLEYYFHIKQTRFKNSS